MINLKFDVEGDLEEFAKNTLCEYILESKLDTNLSYFYQYIHISNRLVSIKPRKVHFSKSFKCPIEFISGLKIFIKEIETGKNINLRLSKLAFSGSETDKMQADFNLYHFHLGTELEKRSDVKFDIIKRTKPLAIVFITDNDIYFIRIIEHGEWCNIDFVEVIHREWPELIEGKKLKNFSGCSLTINEIKNLRKKNINYAITMPDGVSYMALGDGLTICGSYTKVKIICDRIKIFLKNLTSAFCLYLIKNLQYDFNHPLIFKIYPNYNINYESYLFHDSLNKLIFIHINRDNDQQSFILPLSKKSKFKLNELSNSVQLVFRKNDPTFKSILTADFDSTVTYRQ